LTQNLIAHFGHRHCDEIVFRGNLAKFGQNMDSIAGHGLTEWLLRNFEDFYRNFTGIFEDGEWNFKNTACISDIESVELMIPSVKTPCEIPELFLTSTPNTGIGKEMLATGERVMAEAAPNDAVRNERRRRRKMR
jgi:hypothetical protein